MTLEVPHNFDYMNADIRCYWDPLVLFWDLSLGFPRTLEIFWFHYPLGGFFFQGSVEMAVFQTNGTKIVWKPLLSVHVRPSKF